MIGNNLERIKARISSSCNKLSINPKDIILVCVTKERTIEQILKAISFGITDIGENKVQEALAKFKKINSQAAVRWHMVGHLQTNKVKQALQIFDMIHSLDSLRLAQEIEEQAEKLKKRIDVLIQVNTTSERTKFGVNFDDAIKLIGEVSKLENLQIRGLMAMAPLVDNPEDTRPCFRKLRILRDDVIREFQDNPNVKMDYLSMGMSQDYEVAIEEGANMLRIGRAIFTDG